MEEEWSERELEAAVVAGREVGGDEFDVGGELPVAAVEPMRLNCGWRRGRYFKKGAGIIVLRGAKRELW